MSASQPDSQGSIISSFSLDKPPTTLCSSPTALPVLMNSHTGSCPGLGRRPSPPWIPSHPSRAGLSASSPRSFPFSTATAVWIPLLGPPPAQEWSSPARRLFQLCPRGAEGSRGRRRWGSSLCPQSGRRANACNLTLPFQRKAGALSRCPGPALTSQGRSPGCWSAATGSGACAGSCR